jgi:CubicO group peptidase (beta-lactamase class C family)
MALALGLALARAAWAEDPVGDWTGALTIPGATVNLALHIRRGAGGVLGATLDSPDQGFGDIPVPTVTATGTTLSLSIPLLHSAYKASWDAAGRKWIGTWTQSAPLPLVLTRGLPPRPAPTCPETASSAAPTTGPKWCDILIWTPGQQAAAYRAMDRSFDVRTVHRGGSVAQLPHLPRPLAPAFQVEGETWTMDDFMRRAHVAGVLVLKGGAVWLEGYGLGMRPGDRWIGFSVTKSVTSTLIGAAIEDGAIKSLDAAVTDYLPELKGGAYDGVTVRQLITMTTGVRWNENYGDPKADIANYDRGAPGPNGESPVLAYMAKLPRAAPPGTRFNYSTGDATLAGLLVARATHKSLSDYLSEKIWSRLGMETDAAWVLQHGTAQEQGGWGLSMDLRDEGRLGLFVLDGGVIGGRRVLPEGWVADASANHIEGRPPGQGYGYYWWMRPVGFSAVGVYGQSLYIDPQDRLVVVIQSAWPFTSDVLAGEAQTAFLTAVVQAARAPQPLK